MMRTTRANILIIGRGEAPVYSDNNTFDSSEIQCCRAIIENGNHPVLMTNVCTERGINAILNISVYPVPFFQSSIDEIVEKENIDTVFAPFIDSRGWKLVQELERSGYWEKHQINVIQTNIPHGYVEGRFQKIRLAISEANLKQPCQNEISSVKEAHQILNTIGGLPVLIRSEDCETKRVTTIQEFNLQVSRYLANKNSDKVYLEKNLTGWKEVKIGLIKDRFGDAAVVFTSEHLLPVGIASNDSITVSPIQSLDKDDQQFLNEAALRLVKNLEGFSGFCAVKFALDPDKNNTLVSDVNFSIENSAKISLSIEESLINILTKLAMGARLSDWSFIRGNKQKENPRILLCVPDNDELDQLDDQEKVVRLSCRKEEKIFLGHNFCEVLLKFWHQRNVSIIDRNTVSIDQVQVQSYLMEPYWDQLYHIYQALRLGISVDEIKKATNIDSWFLVHIKLIADLERELQNQRLSSISELQWKTLKNCGFSDAHIAGILSLTNSEVTEIDVLKEREKYDAKPLISTFFLNSSKRIKPEKTIMLVTDNTGGPEQSSLKIPALLFVMEARRMGYNIVIMTSDTQALPFWMSFADRLYVEPLNCDSIYEIYKSEGPSGIFIEGDKSVHKRLKEQFEDFKVPIVHVPIALKLPNNNQGSRGL